MEIKPKKQIPIAELLKEKRHEEVKALLLQMLEKLNTPTQEIEYNDIDVSGIERAISDLKIDVDLTELPKSIQALGDIITTKIENIKPMLEALKHPKEWDFTIDRNAKGFIKSVNAKAK